MKRFHLVVFTVVTLAAGWIGAAVDDAVGLESGQGPGMLIWILLPFLTSALLRSLGGRRGWSDFGLRPAFGGHLGSYAISILFYPAIALAVGGFGLLIGRLEGRFDAAAEAWRIGASVLVISQIWTNLFEEFAFRGYLAPKGLAAFRSRWTAHLLTGLVWGAWHIPYLPVISPFAGERLVTLVPRFLAAAVAASLVYGEIRHRTGSLWPAVLMQFTGGLTFGLAARAVVPLGADWLFLPSFEGGLVILVSFGVGWAMMRR